LSNTSSDSRRGEDEAFDGRVGRSGSEGVEGAFDGDFDGIFVGRRGDDGRGDVSNSVDACRSCV